MMNQERIAMEKAVGPERKVPMSREKEETRNAVIGIIYGVAIGLIMWAIIIMEVVLL